MKFLPTMKSLKAYAAVAFASAAMFAGSGTAEAQHIDWNYLQGSPVRFEWNENIGNQPGVQDGYHQIGGFLSVLDNANQILFIDGTANSNYQTGNWSGSIGTGYRQDLGGTVLGGNVFYSVRDYGNAGNDHNFSTLGFGAEALMSGWALRTNAWWSLSDQQSNGLTATPLMGGPILQDEVGGTAGLKNILLATQTENFDSALDGFDLTAAVKIPAANTEVSGGVYYLSADGGPDTWGVSGSAETWIASNVAVNATVSHDDFFDTTVYGGVSLYFGGPAIDVNARSSSVVSRLWSRVQRRDVVPVYNYTLAAPDLLATDTATGDLISVACVDAGALAQDLVDAAGLMEVDGDLVDIIIAGTAGVDSVFDLGTTAEGGITLSDGQRLLGANKAAMVEIAQFGGMTIALPGTSLDAGLSTTITGVTDTDIITIMGDGIEVSGLSLTTAGTGNAIVGDGVTDFDINCNIVTGGGGIDLGMTGVDISGVIEDNMITAALGNGIDLDGNNIDVDLTNNTVVMSTGDNVSIEADADFSGDIMGNTMNDSLAGGLSIDATTISGDIINNIVNGNTDFGISVEVDNVAAGEVLDIVQNTTNLNGALALSGADGIELMFNGDVDSEVFIDDNTADGNDGAGISVDATGMGDILGQISNNTTNGNGDVGIDISSSLADINVDVLSNLAGANDSDGIRLATTGNFDGTLDGNTASLNMGDGLRLIIDGDVAGMINGNTASGNSGAGLRLEADLDLDGNGAFSADVTGNTAIDNVGDSGIAISGASIDSQITGNTANDNMGDDGLEIIADGDIAGLIDGNTANGNADNGISIIADFDGNGVGDVTATVSNNTVGVMGNGNASNGLLVTGENLLGDITGNVADANTGAGVSISTVSDIGVMGTPVQITGNMIGQIAGNGGIGLDIDADDIFANIDNNLVSLSGDDNIQIFAGNDFNGSFSGNVSNGSTGGDGTDIITISDLNADITGNTASMNFENGLLVDVDGIFNADFTGNTAGMNNVSAGGFLDFDTSAESLGAGTVSGNTGVDFGFTNGTLQIATP